MSALATASAPNTGVNGVALTVLIVLFLAVTVMGFLAARWRRAESMESLDEWGLGGRGFGTWVTWFLLGGDLYTAYTFIAVPAAMFAHGRGQRVLRRAVHDRGLPDHLRLHVAAVVGQPPARLRHRRPTSCSGRYGSRGLSLAVAVTGILATMPYIALQLVGIQAVLEVIGLGGRQRAGPRPAAADRVRGAGGVHLLLGLRAPAMIAFVKDALIYLVIIVAVIYLPPKYGGWGAHLRRRPDQDGRRPTRPPASRPASFIPAPTQYWAYAHARPGLGAGAVHVPALGHGGAVLARRATRSGATRRSCRRTRFVLGLLALLGWVAIAAGTKPIGLDGKPNAAAGRSRSCSRTPSRPGSPASPSRRSRSARWCRRRSCRSRRRTCSPATSTASACSPTRRAAQEAKVSKLVSLLVKFVRADLRPRPWTSRTPSTSSCSAGSGSCRRCPSIVFGLYTRWFHRWALLAGWAVAMVYGTVEAYNVSSPTVPHFAGSLAPMGYRAAGLHRAHGVRHQRHRGGGAHADPAGAEVPGG